MTFDYVIDQAHGPYYTIQEAFDASQRSWWRRLLHRFIYAHIRVASGVYEESVDVPARQLFHFHRVDEKSILQK